MSTTTQTTTTQTIVFSVNLGESFAFAEAIANVKTAVANAYTPDEIFTLAEKAISLYPHEGGAEKVWAIVDEAYNARIAGVKAC